MAIQVWEDERIVAVLLHLQGAVKFPGGLSIAAGSRGIRSGDILTRSVAISGGNQGIVCKWTRLRTAASSGDTTIEVDDAHPFEVGDPVHVGEPASLAAINIVSIDYVNNIITLATGVTVNKAVDDEVEMRTHNAHRAVAIANTPLVDRYAYRTADKKDLVTPRDRSTQYGDAYVMGTFKADVIQNGQFENGSQMQTDLAGLYSARNKTFVISSFPPITYPL